jgi:hypothetical protein
VTAQDDLRSAPKRVAASRTARFRRSSQTGIIDLPRLRVWTEASGPSEPYTIQLGPFHYFRDDELGWLELPPMPSRRGIPPHAIGHGPLWDVHAMAGAEEASVVGEQERLRCHRFVLRWPTVERASAVTIFPWLLPDREMSGEAWLDADGLPRRVSYAQPLRRGFKWRTTDYWDFGVSVDALPLPELPCD